MFRAKMQEGLNDAQQAAQNGDDPMAQMGVGLMRTVQSLEAATFAAEFGNAPAIHAAMDFPDDQSAADFLQAYSGVVGLTQQMLLGQIQQMGDQAPPQMPKEADVRQAFGALSMKQEGTRLRMTIDKPAVEAVGKMVPMAMMMMMMGGMGPGGPGM